jgi:hypothetical protein
MRILALSHIRHSPDYDLEVIGNGSTDVVTVDGSSAAKNL